MATFIDRRLDGKNKSAVNRQRFIRRFKGQIKKAVAEAMNGRSITDIDNGEKINIPARDLSEPVFGHGPGGRREAIHPGNKEFTAGDRVARPPGGGGAGGGGQASNSGEGEDDFVFELSRDEFLELFFEDLELPHLVRTQLAKTTEFKSVRAGFTSAGNPANIDVVRSMRGALARRMAMAAPYSRRLRKAEEELQRLLDTSPVDEMRVQELSEEVEHLRARVRAVPFIDTFDLRYVNRVKQPQPTTQAVMFCIMDVSGSMDRARKDLAKRFFTLLYLFLKRNYEKIEVVFIRHHTVAKEVDEQEFFYSRETGGTVVSSALQLSADIMRERYPVSSWNLYVAQASDGDNWHHDSPACRDLLMQRIMPYVRYYAYIEITPDRHQSLWEAYEDVKAQHRHFAMRQIDGPADIYPVFRDLFKRRVS
ncbi:MAG TPA: YeaH/YhbH family protein [Candidatus Competibacteraceae bacterium]|nr:YeaH/YhbH family protein [Candidatus Competibacteraceae bacterium]MCP5133617.1 YeaH/YhbH family protein [Gammaproteobacteria bacterium]HPF59584.1 YeaH/YhbH family protein [Candidatus Competibacteraceae bacterium]HRY18254.1 YeaH/YhbH family protein [Candidatus Competibacteraceae bacterium]